MAEYIKREEAIETLQRYGVATGFGTYLLERISSIDPVHAAGGCYCRECARCDGFDRDSVSNRVGRCHIDRRIVTPDGFCKWGKLKEAQNDERPIY